MKLILFLLLTIFVLQSANAQRNPYYLHKKSQFDLLEKNDKFRVIMLGDSITDEGEWHELLNSPLIQNRGISGDTTDGVLDRLDSINKNIKKVFIMIGVNDIMWGRNVDLVFKNYVKIIDTLQKKKIKVYIQSTLYTAGNRAVKFNKKIEDLNSRLIKFAREKKINFIDLNADLSENRILKKEFTFDDLHINGSAYKIWAEKIKPYLGN